MKNIDEEMREFDMLAQIWKPNGPNNVLERQFPFSETWQKKTEKYAFSVSISCCESLC
jgi:hypothetical protein